jgi:hypothetical protein
MSNKKYNKSDTRIEIKQIFDDNQVNDLKRFMNKRQCLNFCNVYMLYLFYLVQSAGILTSSVGASLNNQQIIWIGIALNMFASIIQIYEKINDSQLKRLLKDIQLIKDDKYTDESATVDIDKDINTTSTIYSTRNNTSKSITTGSINNFNTFDIEKNTK